MDAAGIEIRPGNSTGVAGNEHGSGHTAVRFDASSRIAGSGGMCRHAVNVLTGQWVEQGEQLAQLTSEQIGLRNQIKKCEADLRIAQLQYEWAERT